MVPVISDRIFCLEIIRSVAWLFAVKKIINHIDNIARFNKSGRSHTMDVKSAEKNGC